MQRAQEQKALQTLTLARPLAEAAGRTELIEQAETLAAAIEARRAADEARGR